MFIDRPVLAHQLTVASSRSAHCSVFASNVIGATPAEKLCASTARATAEFGRR
jgi:hypothetical protein